MNVTDEPLGYAGIWSSFTTKKLTGSTLCKNNCVHTRVHWRRLRFHTSPQPVFQPVPKGALRFGIACSHTSERNRQSRREYRTEE